MRSFRAAFPSKSEIINPDSWCPSASTVVLNNNHEWRNNINYTSLPWCNLYNNAKVSITDFVNETLRIATLGQLGPTQWHKICPYHLQPIPQSPILDYFYLLLKLEFICCLFNDFCRSMVKCVSLVNGWKLYVCVFFWSKILCKDFCWKIIKEE